MQKMEPMELRARARDEETEKLWKEFSNSEKDYKSESNVGAD